ncbi:GPI mannosyltransferase 2 [Nematocida ausubeli]|nr:GPI mannosyltransferase 2 [Nematocida ausubeli]KAI5162972.1 GPI mannosyltransferase 2 [Nematocida ausubeli]
MIKPAVIWTASRAAVLSASAASSFFIPHHDFSSDLLQCSSPISFLVRWDAIYFHNIAKYGYTSDNMTAFFPLYPMLIRALSYFWIPTVFAGVLLSNFAFLLSSLILYRITEKHFSQSHATRACILFCFSPCSIIYSSLYTESLFCLFTMLSLESLLHTRGASFLWLSLASYVRSNGFILAPIAFMEGLAMGSYGLGIFMALLPVLSFFSVQLFWLLTRFPYIKTLPYSYVQAVYWEQGFMEFYKHGKNIPNIIVGLPFVLLSCLVSWNYFMQERRLLQLALTEGKEKVISSRLNILMNRERQKKETVKVKRASVMNVFFFARLFLHFVLLFQIILSIFFIHMNMHFRFVSYNPVIYWELSEIFVKKGFWRVLLFGYVCFGLSYGVLYGAYFPPA